jgi:hypothetical protein
MTLAAFHVALEGYTKAHTAEKAEEPTDDEYYAALAEEMAAGRA